jgi:PmbA protein
LKEHAVSYADALTDLLERADAAPSAGRPALAGWRFAVYEGRQLQIGVVDNELAGVYSPAAVRRQLSGSIYLIWADGKISNSNLQRETLDTFEERLTEWRGSAYEDPQAPRLLPPTARPEVQLYDPAVEAMLDSGGERLFAILRQSQRQIKDYTVEFLDASASLASGRRILRSSTGLDVAEQQTSFGFGISADSLYHNGYGRRTPIDDAEVDRLIRDVGETTQQLKQPGSLQSGGREIVLAPGIAESFLGTFLLRNFSGSLVANRQARYTLEDFRMQRRVVRPDLSVLLDPLQPFEAHTESCTGEGVPSRRTYVLLDGRLQTPLVDVKYAQITGFPPTPGGAALFLPLEASTFADLIGSVEEGLLVHQVLGMHTQDATSGAYSLTAQQTLTIRDGRLGGRVKATIAGNFLEDLQDPDTAFGWDPHEPNPGMRIRSKISVE